MRRLTTRRAELITPRRRRGRLGPLAKVLLVAVLAFTAWQWGHAGVIHAKAWLAPILIEHAWTESRTHRADVRPWPWADTWPVAKLSVPSLNIEQFVLAGADGGSLPFGPGHMSGSAQPGETGTVVIAGHRDTHFAFLPELDRGTILTLESVDGRRVDYTVQAKSIVDASTESLAVVDATTALVLVTCEPQGIFSSRGPYRLVVRATP